MAQLTHGATAGYAELRIFVLLRGDPQFANYEWCHQRYSAVTCERLVERLGQTRLHVTLASRLINTTLNTGNATSNQN